MKRKASVTVVAALVGIALTAGSISARQRVETLRGKEATLEEVLYLPSGKVLKRMSLGYSTLLANVYWTRAVQYFGARFHERSTRYDLLAPLLDITTDLDPHLIVAYETGSIFLSQRVPAGAGQPDKAVAFLEKGIRENPDYWRLYFTLGFVQYMDRHDPKAAQEAFEKGSNLPGAMVWMKVMAARMAEHGGDIRTAIALWDTIRRTNSDKSVLQNAESHLLSLRADAGIEELQQSVQSYYSQTGAFPRSWSDMIRAGILPGIPLDPNQKPFRLMPDGTVQVQDPSDYEFLGQFRSQTKH
jgi:tetratricopeptide (TPR) repeat protein